MFNGKIGCKTHETLIVFDDMVFYISFNPNKARLFEASFFLGKGGGFNLTNLPFIFQEELI